VSSPPAVCVYGLAEAEAALTAAVALDVPVTLFVREDIAAACGAAVVARLFAVARAAFPAAKVVTAVDCGDAAGLAFAMLRQGVDRVRLNGPEAMLMRVAEFAARTGAALERNLPPALDLLDIDQPRHACEMWLQSFKNRCILPHGE
jgi:hypothetical protein